MAPQLVTRLRRPNYCSMYLYKITQLTMVICLVRITLNGLKAISLIFVLLVSVRRATKKLRHKTKGGPDGLPPSFFVNCCDELCYSLSQFFTVNFEHIVFNTASMVNGFYYSTLKKGKSVDAINYRPIARTCTMCKLTESITKDQMVQFLFDNGLINKHQHTFIKNHSTCTNVLGDYAGLACQSTISPMH
jgi:hypothetical protein